MKTYLLQNDESEACNLLADVIKRFHQHLIEPGVRVSVIVVDDVDGDGGRTGRPALKLHGVAALAIVKINSLKDRVEGKADATIFIDGTHWDQCEQPQKVAILDHELHHLLLVVDEEGRIVADDAGRPKLKMRPHDFQVGWFHAIAERHGPHAVETQQMQEIAKVKWVQGVLDFGG